MILLTMLLIPTLVAIGFMIFGGKHVTLKEFLLQMGIQVIIMSCMAYYAKQGNTSDHELLNGIVTAKTKDKVGCEHSYQCMCVTVSCGKDCSYQVCQTCHYHSYDNEWNVHTSLDKTIEIDRVDWQGLDEPPRYSKVIIGEPVAIEHHYTNYVKGAPDSLFRAQGLDEKFKGQIPEYKPEVYDYYRADRFVPTYTIPDTNAWNKDLAALSGALGRSKQVNVVVVALRDKPNDYFYALQQQWIGGKKNDAVLVINTDSSNGNKISWVEVMAWTDNKIFQVALRDSVLAAGTLNRSLIIEALKTNIVTNYKRKSMEDYAYLKDTFQPTLGQWIFAMILGLIISIGLGVFMVKEDVFGDEYEDDYTGGRPFRPRRY